MNNGKNRQGLAAAAALAFGVLVLAVPEAATRGFAGGTALCLQSVLPALFPFFVVCELLTAAPPPAVLLRPMQRVLGLASAETARALLLSWVGGYAVCARLAGQLYGAGRITRRDAALLQVLGCCSGPGFVIGCVGGALLGNVRLGAVLYAAQIGANLGAGAVCQLLSHIVGANMVRPLAVSDGSGLSGKAQPRQLDGQTMFAPTDCTREVSGRSKILSPTRCGGSLLAEGAKGLPQAISSAVTSSLSVCGCVVFFRIVGAVLLAVLPLPPTVVSAALEVSAGCADFAALGGAAVRLLRLPERARCLGLGAAAAVCRGGVPPAAASFQPRGAPCTFAAARQGVCAAAARQRYGMQYTGRPRPAGFPSAAGRRGGGVCLSLRSSLQGPAKSL